MVQCSAEDRPSICILMSLQALEVRGFLLAAHQVQFVLRYKNHFTARLNKYTLAFRFIPLQMTVNIIILGRGGKKKTDEHVWLLPIEPDFKRKMAKTN